MAVSLKPAMKVSEKVKEMLNDAIAREVAVGIQYIWQHVQAINGKVLGGPAPPPLDTLPTKIQSGERYVVWETFKVRVPRKIPV